MNSNKNNDYLSLKDKNIVVTGAASGIGRECAILFSKLGANLILLDMVESGLKETIDLLQEGNHLSFIQDITKYASIEDIIQQSVEKLGKISGFLHCAGIEISLPLKNLKDTHYEKIFAVNVISAFEISKILSKKKFIHNESASFVYIASIMGIVSQKSLTAYSASKGGLISGSRAIALELAKKNIRVNCISPGHINTPLMKNTNATDISAFSDIYPLGKGLVSDVSNSAAFLLSDLSRWITGQNLVVDGGYTLT